MQRGFQRGGRAWGDMTSILADTIPGIRVVKAFAQEKREIERFRRANDQIVAANDRVNLVWTFFWPMVVLLNQVGLVDRVGRSARGWCIDGRDQGRRADHVLGVHQPVSTRGWNR